MNESIWNKWIVDWNWILSISKKRNWNYEPIEIKSKTDISRIEKLEAEIGIIYPAEFKNILTNYSSAVKFGWQITNEETSGEFRHLFCGCGGVTEYRKNAYLWDFDNLSDLYKIYQGWLADCYNDPKDEYGKHYYGKVPFIEVPNGDMIVFDNKGQIIYLSHDDGPLHGEKLSDNFIEFVNLWSNLGCVGTESEQFSVFYDYDKHKLMDNNPKIERWKQWLKK
jgi:hypothetical protein